MKYLKSWLQDYIIEDLPDNNIIIDALNKKAFEVEEIIYVKCGTKFDNTDDILFDIKVLPNRAGDALCHREMAREIAVCLNLNFKNNNESNIRNYQINNDKQIEINIQDNKACSRFISVLIEGVKVGPSPKWLSQRLIAIGEKSINNIVDITNYVQFAINKPMHAYNQDSVKDKIIVRFANDNEKLITLDDRELELNNKTLVIADTEKVLGLAGVKGGKYSGINNDTKNIIIESANFDSVLIRKTSQKYNIRTDASKRFENGLANNLTMEGIEMTISLISKLAKEEGWNIIINKINDNYPNKDIDMNRENRKIYISSKDIYNICHIDIDKDSVINILNQLGCNIEIEQDIDNDYSMIITTPKNRLDITLKEDIIEEIIRIYGFDNIAPSLPDINRVGKINKYLFVENIFRNHLSSLYFNEVYNYTFRDKGEIKVAKPLADDKKYLRDNMIDGMVECFEKNIKNIELLRKELEIDKWGLRLFEFGNVFKNNKEERVLVIGIWYESKTGIKWNKDDAERFIKDYIADYNITGNVGAAIKYELQKTKKHDLDTKDTNNSHIASPEGFRELIDNIVKNLTYKTFLKRSIAYNRNKYWKYYKIYSKSLWKCFSWL